MREGRKEGRRGGNGMEWDEAHAAAAASSTSPHRILRSKTIGQVGITSCRSAQRAKITSSTFAKVG